ncbi:hypothetical protein C7M84_020602 [Penaeus vannamei]|uniref:Uncharacterized protein n=1 Tax=Penaeus vannamei TaxID=6689 RepID=A0A423SBL5_PENVA|nr:hypothetical protein C7M84_020602 [Penaeus vannamei]
MGQYVSVHGEVTGHQSDINKPCSLLPQAGHGLVMGQYVSVHGEVIRSSVRYKQPCSLLPQAGHGLVMGQYVSVHGEVIRSSVRYKQPCSLLRRLVMGQYAASHGEVIRLVMGQYVSVHGEVIRSSVRYKQPCSLLPQAGQGQYVSVHGEVIRLVMGQYVSVHGEVIRSSTGHGQYVSVHGEVIRSSVRYKQPCSSFRSWSWVSTSASTARSSGHQSDINNHVLSFRRLVMGQYVSVHGEVIRSSVRYKTTMFSFRSWSWSVRQRPRRGHQAWSWVSTSASTARSSGHQSDINNHVLSFRRLVMGQYVSVHGEVIRLVTSVVSVHAESSGQSNHVLRVMVQYVSVHGEVISHVNISGVRVEDGGSYSCSAAKQRFSRPRGSSTRLRVSLLALTFDTPLLSPSQGPPTSAPWDLCQLLPGRPSGSSVLWQDIPSTP